MESWESVHCEGVTLWKLSPVEVGEDMQVEDKVFAQQMAMIFTNLGNYKKWLQSDYKECYIRSNAKNLREYPQGER